MTWMKGVVAIWVLLLLALCAGDHHLEIKTESGVVKGRAVITGDGKQVNSFLGIPFAAPTSGTNRFAPPKEVEPWQGIFDATSYSAPCYQVVQKELKQLAWLSSHEESEDCLKINIWVPKHRPKKSAVMVWFHGGGFVGGSTDVPFYDATTLSTQENIIVVTVNYRLSSFGFLYLGHPDAPGNVGLMDQAAGLQWVRKNIKYFGGDPEKVTIFGESAGGASVGFHLLLPTSGELFKNAILQSGNPNSVWATSSHEEAIDNALQLAKHAGCPHTKDKVGEIVQCLQKLSADEFLQLSLKVEDKFLKMVFRPVIDGSYLSSSPSELLSEGKFCDKKNVIAGFTRDDGSLFLSLNPELQLTEDTVFSEEYFQGFIVGVTHYHKPSTALETEVIKSLYTDWDATDDKFSVRTQMVRFSTDRWFGCSTVNLADKVADKGNSLYLYRFDHVPESRGGQPPLPSWFGSTHADELYFVFGQKLIQEPAASAEEVRLAKQVMRYWANFARNDDPNDEYLPLWPKYTTQEKLRLHIDGKSTTAKKTDRLRECNFWEHSFPKINARLSKQEL